MLAGPLALLAGTSLFTPGAGAQAAYPSRPVRLIVPYAAGQGSDVFARRFAESFHRQFGQGFIVENKVGAGGNIGAAAAARSEPDGYSLLWGTNGTHAGNEFVYATLGFDPVRDFEPVAGVLRFGMVLASGRGSRYASLAELAAAARRQPGQISVGCPSTTARVLLQMIRDRAGLDLLPVPYTGSGQALTGLLRNDVQVSIDTVTAALAPIRQGQVTALALSTARRSESLPDLPTLAEAGVEVALEAWNALYAPRGTPPAIIQALNRAVNTALGEPAIHAAMVQDGADPLGGTPADLAALMRRDRALWEPVIRKLGLAAQ
ncbi:tripartite tricarboxylate transporter substrate binding protein [Roseomonas sp. GC11]|uniref:Bug family tripartite tricarboxylate transporter substrate binding protein n=1 Tax=Roseomonas sp. GC11 TaxID=2950546 RepID=UPI00210E2098|nr:tripartite tricarboxylate transporter substrate binding protein [Roseomonas sp. GC11]MCQ4158624.1 tripartite tricarboxylate transporter substrate binding protein [Roseomonas sp. GC11]